MRVTLLCAAPARETPALRVPDYRLVPPRVGTSKIRE